MAARKKSEYAWMRYFALKVFLKQMQEEPLEQLFSDTKKGKGQNLIYAMASRHGEKTAKTCPDFARFRAHYRAEKGLEGVFLCFPNNRPQAGDLNLAVIRIQGQQEPVFLKFDLLTLFGPIMRIVNELEGPPGEENPFRLKAAEAEELLDTYMMENMDLLLEERENR